MAAKVFFSYSHDDEQYRDQLEKHLSLLRQQGLIESWHDRRITAGSEVDASISSALNDADIILLLVNSSFVASAYCYSREMTRAMERHHAGSATIIPVIVRPCDWQSAPFGGLMAVPTDAKAITQWPNLDEAYTNIAKAIRTVVEKRGRITLASKESVAAVSHFVAPALPRSSNLRLKKEFSDLDADTFLVDAFEYMAKFFEGSLAELHARNSGIDGRFQKIDAHTFTAAVYKAGKKQAECSVRLGSGGFSGNGISYSNDASARSNSFNERLSVKAGDQNMYLQPLGMSFGHGERGQTLSSEGAAELYWSMLIGRLQ